MMISGLCAEGLVGVHNSGLWNILIAAHADFDSDDPVYLSDGSCTV